MMPLDHPDLARRGVGGWLNRLFAYIGQTMHPRTAQAFDGGTWFYAADAADAIRQAREWSGSGWTALHAVQHECDPRLWRVESEYQFPSPAVEPPAVFSLKGFGMLVLSRKKSERIIIDVPGYPPLEVCVVDIRGDKVRLGIQAPAAVGVDRSEVRARKEAEQTEGVTAAP